MNLSGLSTYGLNSHRKKDEHPAYASEGARHALLFLLMTDDEIRQSLVDSSVFLASEAWQCAIFNASTKIKLT